uniref:EIF3F/CSN6-like C-terminal domain-containing protein n=1 Tax=Sciurus vulgaris TaxID=55149 RepID=A0A8D2JMG4_SCIVU
TYPKEMKSVCQQTACTLMFIAILFTITKIQNQPECPSMNEWTKKIHKFIYTMKSYTALKKKEVLSVATWMNLEDLMLSEISPKLRKNDIAINELMKRYCPNSVLVIIDVKPKDLGLPTEAHISVEEVHNDGTPTSKTFEHVTSEIGAEEAEEVGVKHLIRDIKDTTVGTLSQQITNQVHGLKGLNSKLLDIRSYLEKVATGKLPNNHQVIYQLQDVFNLLPDVSWQESIKAFYLKTNDQMVVVYLASLICSLVALHNLINNKIANRDAKKKEGQEKEENKEKSDVKKEEKKEKK